MEWQLFLSNKFSRGDTILLKKVTLFFLTVGLLLIGYAGMQLWNVKQSEQQALAEVKEFLSETQGHNDSEAFFTSTETDSNPSYPELSYQNGQTIGILQIPLLNKELPIVEGTDENALKNGVGHFTGTVYPGQNDQILLSGHRDTVFTGMDKLKAGDTLIVEMQHGSFTYVVVSMEIVDENDSTILRSTAPNEVLVLSTCYPFSYIGNAPQRYIVYATPE